MSGYCPAGKCECAFFDSESYNIPVCRHEPIMIYTDQYVQCPYKNDTSASAFGNACRQIVLSEKLRNEFFSGKQAGAAAERGRIIAIAKKLSWYIEQNIESQHVLNLNDFLSAIKGE